VRRSFAHRPLNFPGQHTSVAARGWRSKNSSPIFHLILDTVGAKYEINSYRILLRRDDNLTQVGAAYEPLKFPTADLW
jgi:D-arabinose 1-dehydrogenase-like Zn-dependent alcohol dehydrogenase